MIKLSDVIITKSDDWHYFSFTTHRNGQLGGEVGGAGVGEHGVGAGERLGVMRRPETREGRGRMIVGSGGGAVGESGDVNVVRREVDEVVDVVEEAAAVYLVHESCSGLNHVC